MTVIEDDCATKRLASFNHHDIAGLSALPFLLCVFWLRLTSAQHVADRRSGSGFILGLYRNDGPTGE
jgi:hypothetical protein